MSDHILKTWPEPFLAIEEGSKRFEFRKTDRDFQVGDTLILQMYDPNFRGYSTGSQRDFTADHGATFGDYIHDANGNRRETRARVTYLLTDVRFGIPDGFCIMSLASLGPQPPVRDPDGPTPGERAVFENTLKALRGSGIDGAQRCVEFLIRSASINDSVDVAPVSDPEEAAILLAKMRSKGWRVAVHNDYRLNGEDFAFWLFTRGDRFVKGEGLTDKSAIIAASLNASALDAAEATEGKR